MHDAVLVHVEVARAGAAAPIVGAAAGEVVLEGAVEARIAAAAEGLEGLVDLQLALPQRLELAAAIVEDAHRAREPELTRPPGHRQRVLGVLDARTHHRVDVHAELRLLGQPLQLGLQQAEALHRDLVRLHVVDADLEEVEAGVVEAAYAVGREVVAVGDEGGDHPALAHLRDHRVELGVHQRLSAAHRDHATSAGRPACRAGALHDLAGAPAGRRRRIRCSTRRPGCTGAWARCAPGSGAGCPAAPARPSPPPRAPMRACPGPRHALVCPPGRKWVRPGIIADGLRRALTLSWAAVIVCFRAAASARGPTPTSLPPRLFLV